MNNKKVTIYKGVEYKNLNLKEIENLLSFGDVFEEDLKLIDEVLTNE